MKKFIQSPLGTVMFAIIAVAMLALGFAEIGQAETRLDAIISFIIAGILSAFVFFNISRPRP